MLRNLPQNSHPSGFLEDGAGNGQATEGEENVFLSLSLNLWILFAKSNVSLRAHRP